MADQLKGKRVAAQFMVNPRLDGGPPSMFICGNDEAAEQRVKTILDQFGWETVDLGAVQATRDNQRGGRYAC